jgi:D-3-phosphoglycerate dehydrogenase / 2-oxoglutarate reductase
MAFKVALIAFDVNVPAWVDKALRENDIDFLAENCATPSALERVAGDADAVWVFSASHQVTAANLPLLKRCGAIIRSGSGTDNIPVAEATNQGILVANTPDAVNRGVSDHAISLILALGRKIVLQDREVRAGKWAPMSLFPAFELSGRTVGLVGFGRIARMVARKLAGFEPNLISFDPFVSADEMRALGVAPVSFEAVCVRSDVVSVHCPLTEKTYHLFDERAFSLMKPEVLFVNTSRGHVVDEAALIEALAKGRMAGAALDVLEKEPPRSDNPLFNFPNTIITPHVGGVSASFWHDMWELSAETAIDLAHGRWPRSCVNHWVQPRWKLSPPLVQAVSTGVF